MYRYISRESCSQFDSLPLTSLTISGVSAHQRSTVGEPRRAVQRSLREPRGVGRSRGAGLRRAAPAVGSERGVSRNVARLGTRSARGGAGVQQARNRRVRRLRKLTRTRTHTHTHTLSLSLIPLLKASSSSSSFLLPLSSSSSSFLHPHRYSEYSVGSRQSSVGSDASWLSNASTLSTISRASFSSVAAMQRVNSSGQMHRVNSASRLRPLADVPLSS